MAKLEAWQAREAQIKHDLSIVPTREFRKKKPTAASPLPRSKTTELGSPSGSPKKSPTTGVNPVEAKLDKKKKKKSPKRTRPAEGFLSPKPVLPGRMQLSPIAKEILDPKRDKPLTEEEVDKIAAHIVQQRRAMEPLVPSPGKAPPQPAQQ